MIISHLKGDLGNQMFQYAIGRIIAEHKGYTLKLDEAGDGWKNVLPEYFPEFHLPVGKEINNNPLIIQPNLHHFDLEEVLNHNGMIFLHGYWQKHYFYTPHMSQLKKWFAYDDSKFEKPDENDIVIHCRLALLEDHKIVPPIKMFANIVNTLTKDYARCIIVTDAPNHPLLDGFREIKNVVIRNKSRMEDFAFMKYAKRLILSQSTFSWWASFLGDQEKVYAPLTINNNVPHYWKATPTLLNDVDLIPDNNKYIKFYI